MRILNEDLDQKVDRATLLLNRSEAEELRDSLELLLKNENAHEHVASEDFQKEVTIAIYDEQKISNFNERCQQLILEDK